MRITWQVCVIIGVCLIALALPIAGVVLTLQTLTKGDARQSEEPDPSTSGLLENVLEGIADEKLAPEELENEEMKIELSALDVQKERERIERTFEIRWGDLDSDVGEPVGDSIACESSCGSTRGVPGRMRGRGGAISRWRSYGNCD